MGDHDERVAIPLDPETALKALLKVDPETEVKEDQARPKRRSKKAEAPEK